MNKLRLNVSKTKVIHFRNINKILDCTLVISFNNDVVAQVKSVMFLDVMFDEYLAWKEHFNHIKLRLRSFVGALYHVNQCLPKKIKIQLYYAMFYSIVYYSLLVYGTTCTTHMTTLLTLQKCRIRFLINAPRLAHTSPIYKELKKNTRKYAI
jgi:hypothetical protein